MQTIHSCEQEFNQWDTTERGGEGDNYVQLLQKKMFYWKKSLVNLVILENKVKINDQKKMSLQLNRMINSYI